MSDEDSVTVGILDSIEYNIGNLFIDLGARASIRRVFEQEEEPLELYRFGSFPTYDNTFSIAKKSVGRVLWRHVGNHISRDLLDFVYDKILSPTEKFNIIENSQFDYFVIPGCILTIPFVRHFENILKKLGENDVKIIVMGGGSNSYSEREVNYVRKVLLDVGIHAFISRDDLAYENYMDITNLSYKGIDNAFFVDEIELDQAPLNLDNYSTITLDKPSSQDKHEEILKDIQTRREAGEKVIKMNHSPLAERRSFRNVAPSEDEFTSLSARDYLTLYANAEEVHADRVHSCVPALAYGGTARLYKETLRSGIFENVTDGDITEELVTIGNLQEEKQNQLEFLRTAFEL